MSISRRSFIQRGGMTVAAAAVAIPGLPAFLSTSSTEAPEVEGDATGAATGSAAAAETGAGTSSAANLAQPIVAQVKNAATGEISIYSGTQEITYRDPEMASRLIRAATNP
jgi:hypothetical protein